MGTTVVVCVQPVRGRPDRRLGRTVFVDERRGRKPLVVECDHGWRAGLTRDDRHLEPAEIGRRPVEHGPIEARHHQRVGHVTVGDHGADAIDILDVDVGREDHGPAGGERPEEPDHRAVEADAGRDQEAGRVLAVPRGACRCARCQVSVGHLDASGAAGGSGREHDVGHPIGFHVANALAERLDVALGAGFRVGRVEDAFGWEPERRHRCVVGPFGHHDVEVSRRGDLVETFGRRRRVQRYVGGPGAEGGEQAGDEVGRPFERHTDPLGPGVPARALDAIGEALGGAGQIPVRAGRPVPVDHGGSIGGGVDPGHERVEDRSVVELERRSRQVRAAMVVEKTVRPSGRHRLLRRAERSRKGRAAARRRLRAAPIPGTRVRAGVTRRAPARRT